MRARLGFFDGAVWVMLANIGGTHAFTLRNELYALLWFAWTVFCLLRWTNWRNDHPRPLRAPQETHE